MWWWLTSSEPPKHSFDFSVVHQSEWIEPGISIILDLVKQLMIAWQ